MHSLLYCGDRKFSDIPELSPGNPLLAFSVHR
jgi:hypothetical protein